MKTRVTLLSLILLLSAIAFNELILFITLKKGFLEAFPMASATQTAILICIPAALMLIVSLFFLSTFNKKKISMILIIIIGSSLLTYTSIITWNFIETYNQSSPHELKKESSSPLNEPIQKWEKIISNIQNTKSILKNLPKQIKEGIKDAVTALIISLFFLGEMMILMFIICEKYSQKEKQASSRDIHFRLIRPIFFLLMFGIDFSISFIPLHMEKLYQPMFGLSKEVIISLPVSLSVFFTGVGFFLAGVWNDKRGWSEPFLIGIAFSGLGNLYSWYAPDAYHFIFAQCVVGIGYGLSFMASQGFVMTFTDAKNKAQGFASLFAALYAGGFCGSSTGAMLAESMGYRWAFLIGALIIFATIGCTLLLMQSAIEGQKAKISKVSRNRINIGRILYFLSRRNVLAVILFSSIPANLAMVGFLNYFNPVYLSRMGVSQSDIGRTFMVYCAFAIYIGPVMSKHIDQSNNKKGYMILGGLIGSLTFFAYFLFEGFLTSIIAIALLGFAHSFIFVAQATYLLKLDITEKLGTGTAIAVYRLANRMGQVAGPMIFGSLIMGPSIIKGMILLGCVYFLLTLLFFLIAQNDQKIA